LGVVECPDLPDEAWSLLHPFSVVDGFFLVLFSGHFYFEVALYDFHYWSYVERVWVLINLVTCYVKGIFYGLGEFSWCFIGGFKCLFDGYWFDSRFLGIMV